jgi:hypothetical protein
VLRGIFPPLRLLFTIIILKEERRFNPIIYCRALLKALYNKKTKTLCFSGGVRSN